MAALPSNDQPIVVLSFTFLVYDLAMLETPDNLAALRQEIISTISRLLPAELPQWPETSAERTMALAWSMIKPSQDKSAEAFQMLESAIESAVPLTDAAGQSRPIYMPFARVCALHIARQFKQPGVQDVLDTITNPVANVLPSALPSLSLWEAYALALAGNTDAVLDRWFMVFEKQQPAGHLHELTAETSLDAFTYDELISLQAAAAIAFLRKDDAMIQQVAKQAAYHYDNTQPDNTTQHPWALAAFARFSQTFPLARQQLHDVQTLLTHRARGPESQGIALGLLACAALELQN